MDADVDALIARGLLDRMQSHHLGAVQGALHRFLDRTLAGVAGHG